MQTGSLGEVVFEVSANKIMTLQELSKENKVKYEEHAVLGSKAHLEFLAPELNSYALNIRLNTNYGVNPHEEVQKLIDMANQGQAVYLIVAGLNLGQVVIEAVSESWKYIAPNGTGVQRIDLSLSLKEYVEWN